MTIFVLKPNCPPRIVGTMQNYTTKVANGVYVTCASAKVVDGIAKFLADNKMQFSIVTKSKHGILPEIADFG